MDSFSDLDRIDFDILDQLQKDARTSNKELAAKVHLAPSSCLERVRKLEKLGAFEGFHAEIDAAALGIGTQALIDVRLAQHSREAVAAFQAHALSVDEVLDLYHLTGEYDFLLHVAVRDTNHLRDVLLDRFTTRPEVAQLRTHTLFSHQRRPVRPNFRRAEESP